jgi:hypothetical protein
MQRSLILTVALLALASPVASQAQIANQALAIKIADAQRANGTQLQSYSWNSRVELMEDAKVDDIRICSVVYGLNNQLQRTVLNDQQAPLPGGFLRKRIAEKKREDVEKYLTGLNKLLDQYTLPTAGAVLNFVSQATLSAPDANGLLQLNGSSVVTPGDTVTLWIDAATRQTRKFQISTTFEGDSVQATATFTTLPAGPTHLAFATVTVPAKNMTLQVHNYDYNKNN